MRGSGQIGFRIGSLREVVLLQGDQGNRAGRQRARIHVLLLQVSHFYGSRVGLPAGSSEDAVLVVFVDLRVWVGRGGPGAVGIWDISAIRRVVRATFERVHGL